MTATTCSAQTEIATGLTLWSFLCSSCNQGSFSDPDCPNANGARVTWDSVAGQQYTLLVYGRQAGSTGQFAISVADFVNPSNDYCDQAIPILPNGLEVLATTINATTRTTSGCGVTKQAPEVWYSITGTGKDLTATTCSPNTDFETGITLWSFLCSSCNQGSLTDVNCGNVNGAAVTWTSVADQVYTLLVCGRQEGATGNFGITVFENDNPRPLPLRPRLSLHLQLLRPRHRHLWSFPRRCRHHRILQQILLQISCQHLLPPPPVSCTNVTVDFSTDADGETLQGGMYVDDEWESFGLILSSVGGFGSVPRLFDTANPGTADAGDPDLGTPHRLCNPAGEGIGAGGRPGSSGENCDPLGNVLIIQESDTSIPDDNAGGGTIVFDFVKQAAIVYEIGFLDLPPESTLTVVHVTDLGMEETVISLLSYGNNAVTKQVVNIENVEEMRVVIRSSGAVTHVSFYRRVQRFSIFFVHFETP